MSEIIEVSRRGRPRSENARQAILAAAIELLLDRGLRAMSMEEVAQRAGVSKATIYRWWDSKDLLALDALSADWAAPRRDAERDTGSLRGDLLAQLRPWLRQLREKPYGRVIAGLVAEAQTDPEFAELYRDHFVRPRRDATRPLLLRRETVARSLPIPIWTSSWTSSTAPSTIACSTDTPHSPTASSNRSSTPSSRPRRRGSTRVVTGCTAHDRDPGFFRVGSIPEQDVPDALARPVRLQRGHVDAERGRRLGHAGTESVSDLRGARRDGELTSGPALRDRRGSSCRPRRPSATSTRHPDAHAAGRRRSGDPRRLGPGDSQLAPHDHLRIGSGRRPERPGLAGDPARARAP